MTCLVKRTTTSSEECSSHQVVETFPTADHK